MAEIDRLECERCRENVGAKEAAELADSILGVDQVFRPSHYTKYTMEPFTFFFLNNLPFAEASVCKYVLRWRNKDGIQDLQKAKRVIEMMIEMETNHDDYCAKKMCL